MTLRRPRDLRRRAARPYESPDPRSRTFPVRSRDPLLHRARRVRFSGLYASGLPLTHIARAWWQSLRIWRALRRLAGTWRYRVRLVRGLRADIAFCRDAPLRALVDHRRRVVYFDYDRYVYRTDLLNDPAVRDEARHIRERLRSARHRH